MMDLLVTTITFINNIIQTDNFIASVSKSSIIQNCLWTMKVYITGYLDHIEKTTIKSTDFYYTL